jgi:hypothetical protein
MKGDRFIFALFFAFLLFTCNAKEQPKETSDSALVAPVDTLGSDTSRQNPVGDSTTRTNLDTAL